MARLIRVLFVVALFSFFTAAPASAGPYMSWGQWTSDPGVPFSQCWDRGAQAFAAVGLSSSQDGRFFHGSNDVFTVSLVCYDLGNRFIVTITVAAERSGISPMTTDQVRDRMAAVIFGTGGASNCASSPVGTWNWWNGGTTTFYANGTATSNGYSGTWERLNDGSYHVHWSYPSDDYFRISADGRSMPGNYNGTAGTSTRQGSC
jgi:hypothetical protein